MKISGLHLRIIFILLFLLPYGTAIAQNNFYKVFGTPYDDIPYRLDRCSDGGYYMSGISNSAGFRYDAYVIRTDAAGVVMWEKTVQFDSTNVQLLATAMLDDESYVLIYRDGNIFNSAISIILKLDPQGDTVWTRTIYGLDICCGRDPVIQLDNGEFLLAGRYQYFMNDPFNGVIFKIDSSGNTIFKSVFSPAYLEVYLSDFIVTPDSEIVSVGSLMEQHIITHPGYAFLTKFDMDGNFISGETYSDSFDLSLIKIVPNLDRTFTIYSTGQVFLKTDTAGEILSAKRNMGSDHASAMRTTLDSGYFINAGNGFARLTNSFDTIWTKTFLSASFSGAMSIHPVDQSITLTAITDSLSNLIGNDDIALLRLDSNGISECISTGNADLSFQTVTNTIVGFDSLYMPVLYGPSTNPTTWHHLTIQSGISSDTFCSPLAAQGYLITDFDIYPNPVSQNTFKIFTGGKIFDSILMMTLEGKIIVGAIQRTYQDQKEISLTLSASVQNGIYLLNLRSRDTEWMLKLVVTR